MTQIRFAPIVRVSTETQEKIGESLRTQRMQIENYVRNLGGVIPDYCWQYSGQEHATPDQERTKLHKLLTDSSKGLFDAVIVCDASRWSRDNRRSKDGLDILRDNCIRFFVAGMEYDLHSPTSHLMIGVFTEFNEFHAKEMKIKSIQNRITRAKRGLPSSGKIPYGRTFDSATETWGVDEQKARNIQWAAEQYLAGKSIKELAKTLDMNVSNFWKILSKRSGDTWEITFKPSSMKFINETVLIKIPRLLSDETINKIHERAASNKTYTHGEIKHKYLLSRMVFCAECGNALFGQTNHGHIRYYRHPRGRLNPCDPSIWLRADKLEDVVLKQLFYIFGDVTLMGQAIERAIPSPINIEKLRRQLSDFENKLESVKKEKQNIIRSIAKGILTDDEALKDLQDRREREILLSAEINKIAPQLENLPTKKQVERSAKLISKTLQQAFKSPSALNKMTYNSKRNLMVQAFTGKDAEGNRRGVYVRKTENPDKPWEITIRGIFGEIIRLLPRQPLLESDVEDLEESATNYAWHYRAADLR